MAKVGLAKVGHDRTAIRIARKPSKDCFAALECDNAGTCLQRISCSTWSCFRNFSQSPSISGVFLKEPLVRGGFVALSFFLSQLMFRCRSFSFGLALCRLQEGCGRVPPEPSDLVRCSQQGCKRVTLGNVVPEFFTTKRAHGFDTGGFAGARGRIHCGQKERF